MGKSVCDNNDLVLLDFLDRIQSAETLDAKFEVFESVLINLGFENVSYTFVPEVLTQLLTSVAPVFKLSKDYNADFIDHYTQANFGGHDFTIRNILDGEKKPIVWWDYERDKRLNPNEREIIEVARQDYGMTNGVTISAYCDRRSMAGVSLTNADKPDSFNLLLQERLKLVQHLSQLFNDQILRKSDYQAMFLSPILNQMNQTELSVLMGLAQGSNIKKIADELKRSEKYINNTVIRSLKTKLNCASRDQLMFVAGKLQIDSLLME